MMKIIDTKAASLSCSSWEYPPRLDFGFRSGSKRDSARKSKTNFRFAERCRYLSWDITRPVLNNNVHRIVLGMLMFKNVFGKSRPKRTNSGNPSFHRVHELNSLALSSTFYDYYYVGATRTLWLVSKISWASGIESRAVRLLCLNFIHFIIGTYFFIRVCRVRVWYTYLIISIETDTDWISDTRTIIILYRYPPSPRINSCCNLRTVISIFYMTVYASCVMRINDTNNLGSEIKLGEW